MRRAAVALAGWLAVLAAPAAAAEGCPRQPVPALLDAVRPVESVYVTGLLSFSAAPSLQHPRVGWVVRAYSETVFESDRREREVVEVLRLQVEHDCNRWFVTDRWEGELAAGEVTAAFRQAAPFLEPAAGMLAGRPADYAASDSVMVDGTGIALEARGPDWAMRRGGHAHGGPGGAVSDLFRSLAARIVPAEELPSAEWR